MKKRLLSLLLAMVMIISMVPVQAFAEEADASELLTEPAVVEEVVAEDVPETTEEDVPETTEEIIPETTEEIIPETTEEIIPETTEELIPEETEELIPEETEELAAEEELLVEDVDAEAVVAEADTTDATEYTLTVDAPEAMRAGGKVTFEPVLTVPGEKEGETVKVDGATFTYALEDAENQGKIGIAVNDGVLTVDQGKFELAEGTTSVDVVVTVKASIPATEAAPTADGEDAKLKEVATKEVTIKAYAALKGIELCVNGSPATAYSLNANGETKSFTVSVKATDGGPLGKVTWTHPSKSLLTAKENEDGTFTYTVNTVKGKVKTGSSSVKASIKEGKKTLKAATSIKVFTAPVNTEQFTAITAPSDVVRAGSKITLTPKFVGSFTDKTLEWKVTNYGDESILPQPSGTISNDGAALIEGAKEWDSYVKVDSKGVVTTSANIEGIRWAEITATVKAEPTVSQKAYIKIQPTLTSFSVKVQDAQGSAITGNPSFKNKFVLKADEFAPADVACDVTWKISVSSKVATYAKGENNTIVVTPKAPGKLTYTATANDGSKVKKSGSVVIGGPADEVTISPVKVKNGKLLPGTRVAVSAKATYTIGSKKVTAKGSEITWTVYEAAEQTASPASTETVKIGEKTYTLTGTDLAKVEKGYLKASADLNKDVTLAVKAESGEAKDYVIVKAGPKYEKTLKVDADEEADFIPGVTARKITTKWAVSDGTTADLAANEKPTIKVSNGTYDEKTRTVTAKKAGKVTVTATLGKQTATLTLNAAYPATSVEITSTKLTVAAGKSLTLKAKAWYDKDKNIAATAQNVTWAITEGDNLAIINATKGVLTAKAVEVGGTVKVTATTDNGKVSKAAEVKVTAKDKTYVTLNSAVAPATYVLKQDNKFISAENIGVKVVSENKPTTYPVEKVTLSKGYANWIDEKADETKGTSARKGIEFTGKTGTMALTVTYKVGEATKTVKATMKVVNAVTSIAVTAPATEVAVGTTVKLTAKVNAGEGEFKPSNSKLIWYYTVKVGDETSPKATLKDGSLKIAEAATYTVWAEAADGYGAKSDEVKITGLKQASYVIVETYVEDGEGTKKVTANNQTITMYRNEPAVFTAKVTGSDYETANIAQGVKWTVTGVEYEVKGNELTLYSDKATTGTVTVTTTDGTKKTATFKVQVGDDVFGTVAVNNKGYATLDGALDAAEDGDTVKLLKDVEISAQLNITKAITFDGNGKKITAKDFTFTGDSDKYMILCTNGATVKNLTLVGNDNNFGLQFYTTTGAVENITLKDFVLGLNVNASEVTATGKIAQSNIGWGNVINVGYGTGIAKKTPCSFDFSKATLSGVDLVYSDKGDVSNAKENEVTIGYTIPKGWAISRSESGIAASLPNVMIGKTGYVKLQDALDAAKSGDTVKLLKDIDVTETLIVKNTVTLDMNGKKLYNTKDIWNEEKGAWSLISVREKGNLTVTGNGELDAKENDVYAIDLFGKETKCTIENGKFTGNVHAVYVHDGELTVNGGTFDIMQLFSQNQPYDFVLNCLDASYKAGTAKITVNGGKYHNYNPAEAKCESPIADFVPDGKASVKVGDWYEVVDAITEGAASATVSTAGELMTAASMVKAGGTIKLADDITLDETLIVSKNLTLNLNGHDITGNDVRAIQVKAGTLNITGKGTISSKKVDKLVEGSSVIRVGENNKTDACGLKLDKNVTVSADDCYGVTVFSYDSTKDDKGQHIGTTETVEIYGKIKAKACPALSTNGTDYTPATITIYSGAEVTSEDVAIYAPSGYLTVNGGTITGATGIYIKSHTVTIKGGTITGNGEKVEFNPNDNGCNATGEAIVIESCVEYPTVPTLTITKGTVKSVNADSAIGIYRHNCDIAMPIVNITGGTFAPANVAAIGKNYYPTLKDAINACPTGEAANKPTTITLLRDVPNAEGMAVESGKNFIVDFGGHTYTLNKPGAGSKNTETNGFQLLKDSTIVFKNGKIDISEDNLKKASNGQNIKRIIQDYAALTLEDMTIDGTNQFGDASLVMSFNNQPVSIVGKTNIIGAKGLSAFDADGNWGGYAQCVVTVNTTGTIVGDIELGSGKLDIQNAKVDGGINVLTEGYPSHVGRISVSGGSFKSDPTPYLAEGKAVVPDGDWYKVVAAAANN